MNNLTSQTITVIRYPMIVCVVLLHTFIIDRPVNGQVLIPSGRYPIFDIFQQLYQNELANVAVPMFFFISGYLFFYGIKKFHLSIFIDKLKRRVHSLLIPYILWNIIFLLFVCLVGLLFPNLLTYKKTIFQMNLEEILYTFWEPSQGLLPLWFLRDLMIINLFTPIIYCILRHKYSRWILLFFVTCYLVPSEFYYCPGIGFRTSFPFIFGAWFSINKKDFIVEFRKSKWYFAPITIVLLIINLIIWYNHIVFPILERLLTLSLIIVSPLIISLGLSKKKIKINPFLSETSFFIFVFHMFIIHIPLKLWGYIFPINGFSAILALILIPFIVSYTCMFVYIVLKKILPNITNILVGNR